MVAPPEYSSALNPMKIGSSTDSSIIPNSFVGLIVRGQPFAKVEVLGSRISREDNTVAGSVVRRKLDRCRFAESRAISETFLHFLARVFVLCRHERSRAGRKPPGRGPNS